MKDKRFKAYFYLCISAFFLILTATLYYSFGYNYDPQTGKSYQAGAIVVRTTPRDASIYKDDELVENNGFLGGVFSPYLKIENLEPKNYMIKAQKTNYYDWEKKVTIQSGQVAKYENIVLIKNSYQQTPVMPDLILPEKGKIWIAANKNEIFLRGDIGTQSGLFIASIRDEKYRLVLDKSQLDIMGEIEDVKWTEDDGRVVVGAGGNLYLIDLRDQNRVYLISSPVTEAIKADSDDPISLFDHYIVYEKDGAIFSFDYVTKKTEQVTTGVRSFFVYQGSLFYFKADDASTTPILNSINLENPTYNVRISSMPQGYARDKDFSLQRYGGELLVLSSEKLYLIDRTATASEINSNVKDARFFAGGQRILYYNDNEIWIYYTQDKTSQPTKSEGENELLTRFSGSLSNIYVYADEEHLFFQENNTFKFTELDGRDHRNTYDMMQNSSGENIFYLGDKDLVYFIGSDRKLYKYDLREQ